MVNWLQQLAQRAQQKSVKVVGLMSGTSADAIDAALVQIDDSGDGRARLRVLHYAETPHRPKLRRRLMRAFEGNADPREICLLNAQIGHAFGNAARRIVQDAGFSTDEMLAVGSHGQTLWHEPPHATLQIGCPAAVAVRSRLPVVDNFRAADVALGGQGAPLAPYIDWTLFRSSSVSRALLNIGGIANIAFLPAGGEFSQTTAFDTGPGNALMDAAAAFFTNGKRAYDNNGEQAAQGKPDSALLQKWTRHPYCAAEPPKSSGREMFGAPYARTLIEEGRRRQLSDNDLMATLTAFTAETIADAAKRHGPPDLRELIVSGGGALNRTLMRMLKTALEKRGVPLRLRQPDEWGVSAESKEAALFALLARETLRGLTANAPRATGAAQPAVLGSVTPPPTSRPA